MKQDNIHVTNCCNSLTLDEETGLHCHEAYSTLNNWHMCKNLSEFQMRGTKTDRHYNLHQLRSTYLTSSSSVHRLWCKLKLDFSTLPLHQIQTHNAPTP